MTKFPPIPNKWFEPRFAFWPSGTRKYTPIGSREVGGGLRLANGIEYLPFLAPKARVILNAGLAFAHGQATFEIQLNREASVKTNMFVALLFATALTASTAVAQPAPFNTPGVTMGHWRLASKDVEANKKPFLAWAASCSCPVEIR
jgi:hypothetical protein